MRSGGAGIIGFGSYLPPTVRTNDHWPPEFWRPSEDRRRKELIDVERTSTGAAYKIAPEIAEAMAVFANDPYRGIKQRHVIDDFAEPSDLEAEAGRRAIRAAGVRPDEINLVMVYSMVPDRITPSNAGAVQAKCELTQAVAWSFEAACAAFHPLMVTADAFIRGGAYRRILIVSSSAASRVMDYTTGASAVFGDGAAAVVISAVPEGYGLVGHWARTDGSLREGIVFAPVVDGTPQKRWERAGGPIMLSSFDYEMGKTLGWRSMELCKQACLGALDDAGLTMKDVALYVGGQGLPWFVDACRRSLGLSTEQTIDTFSEVGNLGTCNIPFNLERAWRQGRLRDGDIVLTYSPGAGLTRTSLVYRWYAPKEESII